MGYTQYMPIDKRQTFVSIYVCRKQFTLIFFLVIPSIYHFTDESTWGFALFAEFRKKSSTFQTEAIEWCPLPSVGERQIRRLHSERTIGHMIEYFNIDPFIQYCGYPATDSHHAMQWGMKLHCRRFLRMQGRTMTHPVFRQRQKSQRSKLSWKNKDLIINDIYHHTCVRGERGQGGYKKHTHTEFKH